MVESKKKSSYTLPNIGMCAVSEGGQYKGPFVDRSSPRKCRIGEEVVDPPGLRIGMLGRTPGMDGL